MKKTREPGTPPGEGFIPLCVPCVEGNEWKYVKVCLDTNWVSSAGPFVNRFEKMVSEYVGTKYAVAAVNGTAAIHLSLMLLGVGPGDEVVTSDMTFVAPANAIKYTGAEPVFIDPDYDTFQMNPGRLYDFLDKKCRKGKLGLVNRDSGRIVKAILPVHILGHCCDMEAINAIAEKFSLPVVEDATEAFGSKYAGKLAGAFGKMGIFSFNGNKIITTGGGGMLVTDDRKLAEKAKYLTTQAKDDSIEFIHNEVGYNYRLSNVLSAIGCAQMEKLDDYIVRKRKIASTYNKRLGTIEGVVPMSEPEGNESTFWLYTVKIDKKKFGMDRKELMKKLAGERIDSRPLWQPMHLLKAFESSPYVGEGVSTLLKKLCISLPCSTGLKRDEQARVIRAISAHAGKKR
ncbi:MAG TPA: LegC family aminotransferase [Acidobacteriota bacterium]|nr:LegC family aminotransferase [Acidobacteriota bacterium]HNT17615.1 LegC family aminotransferase [Acidobacteriota bacterium]